MRVFDLAFKDIYQIIRDIRSLLFFVVMPIVFTVFMGFAYRGGGEEAPADNRISLGWVNNDPDGDLSNQLYEMLAVSDSVKLVEIEAQRVDEAVRDGEIPGALVVPSGFSQQATTSPLPLKLVTESSSTDGQSLFQSLRAPVTQLFSAVEIANLSVESFGETAGEGEWQAALLAALEFWAQTNNISRVKVEMAVAQDQDDWFGDNPYNQASPGILVQFAIMGIVTSGQILVQERKTRTLQRMKTTNMRPSQIIGGHMLGMFVLVFLQIVLLVVFGQWVLGANYFRQPLAVLLISVAMALWIAAMGLLISTIAKDDSQVVLFSMIAMFVFSSLGGTWFPLEATGGAYAAIGGTLPSAWAMEGYQNILIRGLGLGSVWTPVAFLLVYALVFLALAVWRFRKLDL